MVSLIALAAALVSAAGDPEHSSPAAEKTLVAAPQNDNDRGDWTIRRVGGDLEATVEQRDGTFVSGTRRISTPLPDGYPRPTPPGALELKKYPTVRRAEVCGDSDLARGSVRGFWPLFRHISSRDIAMTAPVEIEVKARNPEAADIGPGWRMSFLYRSRDLGRTGEAERGVTVVDAPPITVLSIGVAGRIREDAAEASLETLYDWLGRHAETWRRAGDARLLGYNAPMDPIDWQWSEVQIPVERIAPESSAPQNGASADERSDDPHD